MRCMRRAMKSRVCGLMPLFFLRIACRTDVACYGHARFIQKKCATAGLTRTA